MFKLCCEHKMSILIFFFLKIIRNRNQNESFSCLIPLYKLLKSLGSVISIYKFKVSVKRLNSEFAVRTDSFLYSAEELLYK